MINGRGFAIVIDLWSMFWILKALQNLINSFEMVKEVHCNDDSCHEQCLAYLDKSFDFDEKFYNLSFF